MEQLEKKIARVLSEHLPGKLVDPETLPNDHVCGHVVSERFVDQDYEQRRKMIREILEQHLTAEEQQRVSTLLTYSPSEWAYEPS